MKRSHRRLRLFLLLFALLFLLLSLPFFLRLRRSLPAAAADRARFLTENILTQAAASCAEKGLFSYEALMHPHYTDKGELLALNADTAMLHLLSQEYLRCVNSLLGDPLYTESSLPLFPLLGSDLFGAWGPAIPLRLTGRHTLSAQIVHSLEEAGVNQSLHTLTLRLEGTVTVLLSGGEVSVEVCRDLPVCQTLLVGKVPSFPLSVPENFR